MPKQNRKMIGPAMSASSIMRASTPRRGLSTVIDLARIWEKLIPSSSTLSDTCSEEVLDPPTF